ncbi:probable tRNA (guanine(26)-N(2))-dimethyltransferase 1 isoform X1 [Dendrobium catenatum]|uniref:probable tRNA (guanine(26)-N(2))-dimethyltransferase 1 isoform X1 n=1 Tax=Dendrobium catenatum TaxID=906689 RepID=UPI0009F541EA|nr:probable tRNA (guanine(26)-N(2))-dimethyltransferase 1 isoform X1 [Dendrobium catenatum]
MSIAVLRTYISRHKEEYAAKFNLKNKFQNEVQDEMQVTNLEKCQGELRASIVLEALAASGLRAIRYACEVDGIGQVLAIDKDKVCIEICKKNIILNGPATCSKVAAHLGDARVYMLTHPKEFDVVDLDPYGTPSIFLDSAVQSLVDGGLLMCTATDLAVLCGEDRDVCYSKYGSYPLKGKYCHEMALRILLACIESHANRYKRFIVPVLSVYMDYYIRVFVRVYTSPIAMKKTTLKLAYVYQCVACDSFHLQRIGRATTKNNVERYAPAFGPVVPQACSDCGKQFHVGGPIWSSPIHDQAWVESILADVRSMKERYPAYDRISSVLTAISEELSDAPLFLSLHNLCRTLKCTTPPSAAFHSVVINAGYSISGTHITPLGFKSNAPMHVIWDIMRCWVKNHPLKSQPAGEPGTVILGKEPSFLVNFTQPSTINKTRAKKAARFLLSPEKSWGPMLRGGRLIKTKHRQIGEVTESSLNSHENFTNDREI